MPKLRMLNGLVTLALVISAHASCIAAPCTLSGLGWMAGGWRTAADPASSQERWALAPGGVLMGSSFEMQKDGTGYAEIMTVRQDGASIVMVLRHFDIGLTKAWEERAAPMVFVSASCEGTSAVFDGQGDHQGEHLTYKRTGDSLAIVGDFLHHGKPDHEEWQMVLGKD